MATQKFTWRLESLAKGVDPVKAAKEFKRIEKKYGELTPDVLLDVAKNEDCLFHELFEWDDSIAAEKYRRHQARTIINNIEVVVISDGQERNIPAYEIISKEDGRSYKRIDSFTPDDREQVKRRTVMELNSIRNKLSFYKEFDFASVKIDEAVLAIKEA